MNSAELKKVIAKEFDKGDCIVAFLDILGFQEYVKRYFNSDDPEDKKILENINDGLIDGLKNVKESENQEINLVKYKLFSDCVCFSIPTYQGKVGEVAMLSEMVNRVVNYSFHLIRRNIYPRGGIAVGPHYQDENIIFSDGLNKAHYLEDKIAIYPRTILDEELVQRFNRLWIEQKDKILEFGTEKRIVTYKDGITFINPFNLMQSMGKYELKNQKKPSESQKDFEARLLGIDNDFNKKVLANVENLIEEYKDKEDVLCKYLWLKDLIKWNMDPKSSNEFEYLLKH